MTDPDVLRVLREHIEALPRYWAPTGEFQIEAWCVRLTHVEAVLAAVLPVLAAQFQETGEETGSRVDGESCAPTTRSTAQSPTSDAPTLIKELRDIVDGFEREALNGIICVPYDDEHGFPQWEGAVNRRWCGSCRQLWRRLRALAHLPLRCVAIDPSAQPSGTPSTRASLSSSSSSIEPLPAPPRATPEPT